MSKHPAVLSASELDNPLIGDTIQVSVVSPDIYRGLDNLVALGIGPFMVFRVGPDNAIDLTFEGKPAEFSMILAFATHQNMMWEVVQPLEGRTIYSDFIDAGHLGQQADGVVTDRCRVFEPRPVVVVLRARDDARLPVGLHL